MSVFNWKPFYQMLVCLVFCNSLCKDDNVPTVLLLECRVLIIVEKITFLGLSNLNRLYNKVHVHYNNCVLNKGASDQAPAGYFTHAQIFAFRGGPDSFNVTFSCTEVSKQCSHCLLDKCARERFMYRRIKTETYPYFSASFLASSSVTAL